MGHLISPTINLGELISLLVTVGGFFLTLGKFAQELKDTKDELIQLRADYNTHITQDQQNFRDLHAAVLQVAQRKGD